MQLFDAEVYVEEKLRQEDLGFSRDILVIVEFILEFPDQVSRAPKASIDSEEYWDKVISRVPHWP